MHHQIFHLNNISNNDLSQLPICTEETLTTPAPTQPQVVKKPTRRVKQGIVDPPIPKCTTVNAPGAPICSCDHPYTFDKTTYKCVGRVKAAIHFSGVDSGGSKPLRYYSKQAWFADV